MIGYTNIILASVAGTLLFFGVSFWESASGPTDKSLQGSHHSLLGPIHLRFWSLNHLKLTLIADADEDSEDSTGDKKDGKDDEDGKLKELWDSVQLG